MIVRLEVPKVDALDSVVKEAITAIAVVLIVLCGIDAALRRDRVGASRAVLIAKALDVKALFSKGRCSRGARQPAADNNKLVLSLICRANDFRVVSVCG